MLRATNIDSTSDLYKEIGMPHPKSSTMENWIVIYALKHYTQHARSFWAFELLSLGSGYMKTLLMNRQTGCWKEKDNWTISSWKSECIYSNKHADLNKSDGRWLKIEVLETRICGSKIATATKDWRLQNISPEPQPFATNEQPKILKQGKCLCVFNRRRSLILFTFKIS